MARTVQQIYETLLTQKASMPDLAGLTSTSRSAIWSNLLWIAAALSWTVETTLDFFRNEILALLETKTPGSIKWYRQLALDFRYGQNLTAEGEYDDTGLTEAQIAAMKIIKYASVTEIDGKLRMKVAKQAANLPVQLSGGELLAFANYMEKTKYAGVKVIKDSLPPDSLKLTLDIWFNPLVLRADGARVDGAAATPIPDAIKAYLNKLPFNGEYSNSKLVDYLQGVDGVVFPVVKVAQSKFGLYPFQPIDEKIIPDAGYMEILNINLSITYREYVS